ncbi:hypothetical protein NITGR_530008 [Nitrospina gracilis 3/211]|uniref:Uncharacterized protein n=1 Tax=Nitrospina gracilis (strain 3/211) TaxID=1266370 RepID=M1ZCD2_NITG3|nr:MULTISPECIES: hypothetical protein [Nitrospina]MCF8723870.1 hypothetical protein [Nitrospina sp. Nb-3]CCQ90990.1 hypothetical protein NITGR_530008 [Nitrospina gracilis 3/211]
MILVFNRYFHFKQNCLMSLSLFEGNLSRNLVVLLVAVSVPACNGKAYWKDHVIGNHYPILFVCRESLDSTMTYVGAGLEIGFFRDHRKSTHAGRLDVVADPLRRKVPVGFNEQTHPLDILKNDLTNLLRKSGFVSNSPKVTKREFLQLGVNLVVAHSEQTSEITDITYYLYERGIVVLDLALIKPETQGILWAARVTGEHMVVTSGRSSRFIEEAIEGAYCNCLKNFIEILKSDEFIRVLNRAGAADAARAHE